MQGSNLERKKEKIAEIVFNPVSKWMGASAKIVDGVAAGVYIYLVHKNKANSSLKGMSSSLDYVLKKYPDSKIYITGDSLGGFVAQFLAVMDGVSGFSFDAPALGVYWNVINQSEFEDRKHQFLQSDLWFQKSTGKKGIWVHL